MSGVLNFVINWPVPAFAMADTALTDKMPILAAPLAGGVGAYWWMNGGFVPTDVFRFGKAYLFAGAVAYGLFWGSIALEARINKAEMGDAQSRSSTR